MTAIDAELMAWSARRAPQAPKPRTRVAGEVLSASGGRAVVDIGGQVHTVSTVQSGEPAAGGTVEVEFGGALPVVSAMGAGGPAGGSGTVDTTVGQNGEVAVSHGLGYAPTVVLLTLHRRASDNLYYRFTHLAVYSISASSFTVRATDPTNTEQTAPFLPTGTGIRFSWWAQ